MFNMFPQTDFRQMDLGYVLDVVKRANTTIDGFEEDKAELNGRIDVLSDSINNPTTGVWKAISDIHAANSSQQNQIDELIANEVFVTPEMFGAVGDGATDDTAALQAAFNSNKPVFLGGDYGITSTLVINHDKLVVCGEHCIIRTLAHLTYAIRFGVDTTPAADNALPGLIQVLWYGGTLLAPDASKLFDYGFSIEKCLNGYLYGVTVKNCFGTGFRWGGDYGANTIADNCIVIGPTSGHYGNCGYLVGRSDQRVQNCSSVDMVKGYFADRGYIRFQGCYCWLTRLREDDLPNVVGYDILAQACSVIDCTVDTIPTGIKLYPTTSNFYAAGLSWLTNREVLPDTTNYVLFKGSEVTVACAGFVAGIQSAVWATDVNIMSDITGLQIIGFACRDTTHVLDYSTAVIDLTAGGGGGAQADWQENDSSADSYVQNRTHWLDGTTYHKLNANYLPYYNNDTAHSVKFNSGVIGGDSTADMFVANGAEVYGRKAAAFNSASAIGTNSAAFGGNGNQATGENSAVFGTGNTCGGMNSFVAGASNTVARDGSIVLGTGNVTVANNQVVLGQYANNTSNDVLGSAIIFRVGCGTAANARKDALTADLGGNVVCGGSLIIATNGVLRIGSTTLTEAQLTALKNLLS